MADRQRGGGARTEIRNAWLRWLVAFVPVAAIAAAATYFLGFNATIAALLVLLAAQLLRQRYVAGRSWRSILWGVHIKQNDR